MKRIQSVLGDQHDAIVARGLDREPGISAYLAGENAFSYGLLYQQGRAASRAPAGRGLASLEAHTATALPPVGALAQRRSQRTASQPASTVAPAIAMAGTRCWSAVRATRRAPLRTGSGAAAQTDVPVCAARWPRR